MFSDVDFDRDPICSFYSGFGVDFENLRKLFSARRKMWKTEIFLERRLIFGRATSVFSAVVPFANAREKKV